MRQPNGDGLGPPLHSDRLEHETLGRPTALAVFASDNLSSCAYATEEILRVLVPFVGLAAFTLVTPVTIALRVVLGFLILSWRRATRHDHVGQRCGRGAPWHASGSEPRVRNHLDSGSACESAPLAVLQ